MTLAATKKLGTTVADSSVTDERAERWIERGYEAQEEGDIGRARKWYLKAASIGDTEAMVCLGLLYEEQREFREAIRWYKAAANAGDPEAMISVGLIYDRGGKFDQALAWMKRAAKSGNTEAMCFLSDFYSRVDDQEHATKWRTRYEAHSRGDESVAAKQEVNPQTEKRPNRLGVVAATFAAIVTAATLAQALTYAAYAVPFEFSGKWSPGLLTVVAAFWMGAAIRSWQSFWGWIWLPVGLAVALSVGIVMFEVSIAYALAGPSPRGG